MKILLVIFGLLIVVLSNVLYYTRYNSKHLKATNEKLKANIKKLLKENKELEETVFKLSKQNDEENEKKEEEKRELENFYKYDGSEQ